LLKNSKDHAIMAHILFILQNIEWLQSWARLAYALTIQATAGTRRQSKDGATGLRLDRFRPL